MEGKTLFCPHSHELELSLNTPIFLPIASLVPSLTEFGVKNQTNVIQHLLSLGSQLPMGSTDSGLLLSAIIYGGSPNMQESLGFHINLEPGRFYIWSPKPSSHSSIS